jgi:threonyl-tRNA synthetase
VVVPVKAEHEAYARALEKELRAGDIRVSCDASSETLNKRIRNAEMSKTPYVAVVGGREAAGHTVSVRSKKKGDLGVMSVEDFIGQLETEIKNKEV